MVSSVKVLLMMSKIMLMRETYAIQNFVTPTKSLKIFGVIFGSFSRRNARDAGTEETPSAMPDIRNTASFVGLSAGGVSIQVSSAPSVGMADFTRSGGGVSGTILVLGSGAPKITRKVLLFAFMQVREHVNATVHIVAGKEAEVV